MILKAKHLYRVEFKYPERYGDAYRGYVLTCPIKDTMPQDHMTLKSFVHIDVIGTYAENSSIYFGTDWEFKPALVSDIIEMTRAMKEHNSELRYNIKTNIICSK